MQKLLLFFLALVAVWYVRRAWQARDAADTVRQEAPPRQAATETVRECARCGLMVPESEGVRVGEVFFCSPEHAREAGGKP